MKRIAVVGSGEIGSRHLQGLAKSKNKLSLYVVDSNNDSLELSKKRYNEIPNSLNDIKFLNNISLLPSAIDIGIISTTSIHRKQLIESLLKISSIKYMILEKIVFQNVEDFDTVVKLFSKNNTKSWVNCNRRTFKIYQKIKEYISGEQIFMKVMGNSWGMACNSIHFIDLFLYLTSQDTLSFRNDDLVKKIIHSKRENFFEIKGKLYAETERGDKLELIDDKNYDKEFFQIEIYYKHNEIKVDEINKRFKIISESKEVLEEKIEIPFQSDQTGILVDKLFDTNDLSLPTLSACMKYHIPMLLSFNDYFSKVMKKEIKSCPIT